MQASFQFFKSLAHILLSDVIGLTTSCYGVDVVKPATIGALLLAAGIGGIAIVGQLPVLAQIFAGVAVAGAVLWGLTKRDP